MTRRLLEACLMIAGVILALAWLADFLQPGIWS